MDDFTTILQSALAPGYTLERELTGGGMSRVFVATDVTLSRQVVVKVLPPELAAGVNHERFRREIQVAAQLQHPHVVPLLSAGEQGSLIWYTMPFIHGQSLRDAIAAGTRYSVKDVVRIMRDVAEALDYAHGLGVIHRDIKPDNVLLMGTHALVTDFGVAKAISVSMPSSGFTSAGMAIGTPAYMAPEQIAADPAADSRMDLYALGLVGYEMLTGQVPFKEDSPQKTMAAQLTREPSPVEQSRTDVPPQLSALIKKLLAKLPEERPQRASDVVTALDDIALSSGAHLAPVRAVTRPSALRIFAVIAAGAAVIATAWMLGERTGTESVSEFMRDSLAAADSTQVVASAASLLTRDDSMAIARAVSRRMEQRAPTPRPSASARDPLTDSLALVVIADSIRAQIQRAVLDSLVQLGVRMGPRTAQLVDATREISMAASAMATASAVAEGAAAPRPNNSFRSGEPRRVVVAMPRSSRGRPEIDAIVRALADSLSAGVDAHPRFIVVPADSVASALRESRTMNAVQEKLAADLFLSIALIPERDSVRRVISLRDLSAPSGVDHRVIQSMVSATDPSAGLSELVPQVVRALLELERARLRQPLGKTIGGTPGAPPPPGTRDRPASGSRRPRP